MRKELAAGLLIAIMALSFAPPSATHAQSVSFYRDLTVGSAGTDVAELQTYLVSKGHLVMPQGVAKGTFGSLTRTALARYQAANGIMPAAGYFGPLTRAHIAADMTPPSNNDNQNNNGGNQQNNNGSEGEIRDFDILNTPSGEEVSEGETVNVFGFEFEAEDSDLTLERLDLQFEATNQTNGTRPWEYIRSIQLYDEDEDKIAELNVSNRSSWSRKDDNKYTIRFTNLKEVVRDGDTGTFYVGVTTHSNLDSGDMPQDFNISIADRGIRIRDEAGIYHYEGNASETVSMSFVEHDLGSLDLKEGDDNPENTLVEVKESADTNNVTVVEFDLEAESSDMLIEEIGVQLETSASNISNVIKNVSLYRGNSRLATESIRGNGTSTIITFDDLSFDIDEDDTETLSVRVALSKQKDRYAEGTTIKATVLGSTFDVENAQGDNVNVDDSVEGGTLALHAAGLNVALVTTSATRSATADDVGEKDRGVYKIEFNVTAFGEDIYIDRSVIPTSTTSPSVPGEGIAWAVTQSQSDVESVSTLFVRQTGSSRSDTADTFVVKAGKTERFALHVSLEPTAPSYQGIQLTGINWTTDRTDTTPDRYHTFNLDDFTTDSIYLNAR